MSRRSVILVLVLAAVAVYGWVDPRNRARTDRGPKYHRSDFTVYQAAAAALRDGTDPYLAENARGLRYVYPPLLAVLLMPAAGLAPTTPAYLFFWASVLALAAAAAAFVRLPAASPRGVVLAFLACAPFLHQSFQRGQVTVILLAAQVGAAALLAGRREGRAGALFAVGGALRLTPLLPAAAVGLGLLLGARRGGAGPVLRYAAGLGGGLATCFLLLPADALGPARAVAVTKRWAEVAGRVYAAAPGEMADLEAEYRINEYRFKNQSPRRILATWTGWRSGAAFEREKPDLAPEAWRKVDGAAEALAILTVLAVLWIGALRLRDPAARGYPAALAVAILLPLLAQRYVWPTHFTAAWPALALAVPNPLGRGWWRGGFVWFVVATLLFYSGYVETLAPLAAAGPLAAGGIVLSVALLRRV